MLHFVAAGKQRVYASDKLGRLRILDGRTGGLVDVMPTTGMSIKVCNSHTDRIYLADDGGIIQCLREVELNTPIAYNESRKPLLEEETKAPKLKSHSDGAAKPPAAHPVAKKPAPEERRRGIRRGGCRRQTS